MSPTQAPEQADQALQAPPAVHTTQPRVISPMTLQKMTEVPLEEPDTKLNLRGGDGRGGLCPGRFCFCIPCPLPCDFCII